MSQFWVVRNVSATEFRAQAGAYVIGVPQPTAISGWIHAWLRGIAKKAGVELGCDTRFVYAVDRFDDGGGLSRNPLSEFGALKARAVNPAPTIDRARGSVVFSVIVEWVATDPAMEGLLDREKIGDAIEASRLMGASLWIDRDKDVFMEKDLGAALKKLGASSFVLADASPDLAEALEEVVAEDPQAGTAEAFAKVLARTSDGSYRPWRVPIIAGYQKLRNTGDGGTTTGAGAKEAVAVAGYGGMAMEHGVDGQKQGPAEPEDRHAQHDHFYVEPLIGVGRFRSRASAAKAERDGRFDGLWTLRSDSGAGMWRLVAEPCETGGNVDGGQEEPAFI